MPVCLACGHTRSETWAVALDEEYFTTKDEFAYHRCEQCKALFIDPVPKDRLKDIYPANYYSFDEDVTGSVVFQIKDWLDQRFFKKFISTLPQPRIRVLDVGGGSGHQLSSLKKVDERITDTVIVDLDEHAGEKARSLGHDYFCGRFEEYEVEHPFDVILMLNLIEHVENPKALLEKAQSLLSPQGIVIVKTPNTESLDARLFRHRNWGGYHCPRHWVLFNETNFRSMVEGAGLNISQLKYTQGAPFWTTSVLYALARKKIIQVSRDRPIPKHPLYPLLNMGFACLDMLRGRAAKTSQMFAILRHV